MGTDQVGQTRNIPRSMQSTYKRLVNANPRARLSVSAFVEHGQQEGGFFETPLIKLSEGVDSLVMTASERQKFLLE
jgi:SCY1-like protein 1